LGKRYTEEEKRLIQELAEKGNTDEAIAQQLGRSTNAIRNYRHRVNIKIKTTQTIKTLRETRQKLTQQTREQEQRLTQLERKQDQLKTANQVQSKILRKRIEKELINLKDRKPELFQITGQEQLAKLTAQLGISFIRWLIE
jgi:hypothetical protein